MIETGLFAITGSGVPRHYAVDVKPDYVGVAIFVSAREGTIGGAAGVMPWADLRAYLETPPWFGNAAGFVDTTHDEVFIPDLPGTAHGGVYKGRSYIFAAGMNGRDELVDFSLLDLAVGPNAQPMPWRNRFAQTAREKVDYSFRHRARERISNALVVFMPIAAPFDQTRIELICETDPILLNGTTLAGRIPDADVPKDGIWFKQFYFHAVAEGALIVPAGGQAEVPVRLRWNKDSAACAHVTTLKLESDAGYLPKRRLVTAPDGTGSFLVQAIGLSPGDTMTVKLNTEHYTAIGKIVVQVV